MKHLSGIKWKNKGKYPCYIPALLRHFDCYGINYVHSGKVWISVNGTSKVYDAPVAWLTYPGPAYFYGSQKIKETWNNHFINFSGERVAYYLTSGFLPIFNTPPVFQISCSEQFYNIFHKLYDMVEEHTDADDISINLLEELLSMCQDENRKVVKSTLTPSIISLCIEMQKGYDLDWKFENEAKALGISYSHFRKLFRIVIGTSPLNLLNQYRMLNAAKKLTRTQDRISAVSEQVGISDVQYFTRLFSRYYGMSPGKFRNTKKIY